MEWLVPFSALTPEQQRAVTLEVAGNKAIIGGPGAGKTLVLLHRLSHLFQRFGRRPNAVHLFAYTTTLRDFIHSAVALLEIPEGCVTTFDKWCMDTFKTRVSRSVPYKQVGNVKMPDFAGIRATIYEQLASGALVFPKYEAVLIDEAQDMDEQAVKIVRMIAKHVSVAMDGKQQLYDGRLAEPGVLHILDLRRHNASLLAAYRCNPMVTRLAAQFIDDEARRAEFLCQARNLKGDRFKPLLFIAMSPEQELERLAELIRLRLSNAETIAILFPQKRLLHGYASKLRKMGLEVDTDSREGLDIANGRPKLLTYHEAKGLTFNTIFMPQLESAAFAKRFATRLRPLMFVGISRATSWVCLSGVDGRLVDAIEALNSGEHKDYLEVQRGIPMVDKRDQRVVPGDWLDDTL